MNIRCAFRCFSGITFIGYTQNRKVGKSNNLIIKVFRSKKTKACAKRWSGVVIEHMNRGVFQSPVGTIAPSYILGVLPLNMGTSRKERMGK